MKEKKAFEETTSEQHSQENIQESKEKDDIDHLQSDNADEVNNDIPEPSKDSEPEKKKSSQSFSISILKAKLDEAKDEISHLREKYMRCLADFDNNKKITQKQVEESKKYAVSSFATELLDSCDNLENVVKHLEISGMNQNEGIFVGIKATYSAMMESMKRHGVEQFSPKAGDAFDAKYHQVVFQEPSIDCPKDTIVQVMRKGYTIKERLLRPASVSVSLGAKTTDDSTIQSENV